MVSLIIEIRFCDHKDLMKEIEWFSVVNFFIFHFEVFHCGRHVHIKQPKKILIAHTVFLLKKIINFISELQFRSLKLKIYVFVHYANKVTIGKEIIISFYQKNKRWASSATHCKKRGQTKKYGFSINSR